MAHLDLIDGHHNFGKLGLLDELRHRLYHLRQRILFPARAMADLIRTASMFHFADVARSVGLEPTRVLREVGLPPTSLQDPEGLVSGGRFRRLLEAAALAAGIDDFGLRLAERSGLSNLGPVAFVVREQTSVGAAVEALARYIHVQNETVRIRIERSGHRVVIAPMLVLRRPAPARQAIELSVGVCYRILNLLIGPGWRPLEVNFAHSPPRRRETYRRFFACKVTFNADSDAIVFPASDMEIATPAADATLARYAQKYVEMIAGRSPDMEGKVREMISALLPTGQCSLERIAEYFGSTPRTIQRKLTEAGTSFSEMLDTQRAALVIRLVEDRSRSLSSVALLLNFSAQSALARWFHGRFGVSITRWRKESAQKSTPPNAVTRVVKQGGNRRVTTETSSRSTRPLSRSSRRVPMG
jgi:AraC-like DNA-binding protein